MTWKCLVTRSLNSLEMGLFVYDAVMLQIGFQGISKVGSPFSMNPKFKFFGDGFACF